MMTTMDLDLRLADHRTRMARVNQEAWMREASAPTEVTRTRRISTVVASIRQGVGAAFVQTGKRVQGMPTGRVVDRAAV